MKKLIKKWIKENRHYRRTPTGSKYRFNSFKNPENEYAYKITASQYYYRLKEMQRSFSRIFVDLIEKKKKFQNFIKVTKN